MEIWTVEFNYYDETDVWGVYSSESLALKAIENIKKKVEMPKNSRLVIDSHDLDACYLE